MERWRDLCSWSGCFHRGVGERTEPSLDVENQPSWAALVQEVKGVRTCQCARPLGTLSAQAGLTTFLYPEGEQLVSWSVKGCLPT